MNWTQYFINIAHQVKLKSKDERTQIGAVIVGLSNQIVSTGYNSFPRGINDNVPERQERPEKYFWFEHAERNALYNASLNGISTKDCSIYLTCGIPCTDCCRGIINAGIREVYCVEGGGASGKRWEEHAKRSLMMFREAGVNLRLHTTTVDGGLMYDEYIEQKLVWQTGLELLNNMKL